MLLGLVAPTQGTATTRPPLRDLDRRSATSARCSLGRRLSRPTRARPPRGLRRRWTSDWQSPRCTDKSASPTRATAREGLFTRDASAPRTRGSATRRTQNSSSSMSPPTAGPRRRSLAAPLPAVLRRRGSHRTQCQVTFWRDRANRGDVVIIVAGRLAGSPRSPSWRAKPHLECGYARLTRQRCATHSPRNASWPNSPRQTPSSRCTNTPEHVGQLAASAGVRDLRDDDAALRPRAVLPCPHQHPKERSNESPSPRRTANCARAMLYLNALAALAFVSPSASRRAPHRRQCRAGPGLQHQ